MGRSLGGVNQLVTEIKSKHREGWEVMGIFVDLKDEFNKVNLRILGKIIAKLRIPNSIIRWISPCYHNRTVKVGTAQGYDRRVLNNGIPQGDILSPVVFLLYTVLVHQNLIENTLLLQSADICLLVWDEDVISARFRLQRAVYKLVNELVSLEMEINPEKSHPIWFFPNECYDPYLQIHGMLGFVKKFKYLGMWIDDELRFDVHVTTLSAK